MQVDSNLGGITVVGSINTDLVVQLPTLPRPGETVLTSSSLQTIGGGKGANQAVAAARLGAPVCMVGAVGDDDFGRARIAQLAAEGIDISQVASLPGQSSGVALITIDANGENTIALAAGANLAVTDLAARCPQVGAARLVLAVLEVPIPAIAAGFELARQTDAITLLNAAPPSRLDDRLLRLVDYLVVNETEAGALAGVAPPDRGSAADLAWQLARRSGGVAIITLGAGGLACSDGHSRQTLPAFETEVVDSTAAGDAFCGALAVALIERRSLSAALRFASAAGSLACTRLGASSSLPDRQAVDRLDGRSQGPHGESGRAG